MFVSISLSAIVPSVVTFALLLSFDAAIALVAAPIVGGVAGLFSAMLAIIPFGPSPLEHVTRSADAPDWGLF